MILVELSLGLAGGGANSGIEWAIVEETHAVVGVVWLAILLDWLCINGGGEVGRRIEVLDSWCVLACWFDLGVTYTLLVMIMIAFHSETHRCCQQSQPGTARETGPC
jgi:hypothetical protein